MPAAVVSWNEANNVLRYAISDEDLEAAAEETALSYKYQTDAYNRCCS